MQQIYVGAALVLLVSGCGSSDSAKVAATASPLSFCAVAARVDVTVSGAGNRVKVVYGDTSDYGQETQPIALSANREATVPLLGLPPGATTHLQAVALDGDEEVGRSDDLTVATGPLDPEVPKFTVSVPGPDQGVILVDGVANLGSAEFAMALDRRGKLLWYMPNSSEGHGASFQRWSGGRLVLFREDHFSETDWTGREANRWADRQALLIDGHDIQPLPNGDSLMVTRVGTETAFQDQIAAVTSSGDVAFAWPTHVKDGEPRLDLHTNALELVPDGSVIVSYRNVHTVAKHDLMTGAVRWRLGGEESSFDFVDGPAARFERQHFARLTSSGTILLFDNLGQPGRGSRAVEYELDEKAWTAKLVWSYSHPEKLLSEVAGSAARLANGNTMVAFSTTGVMTEVDPAGNIVWEARMFTGVFMHALWYPEL